MRRPKRPRVGRDLVLLQMRVDAELAAAIRACAERNGEEVGPWMRRHAALELARARALRLPKREQAQALERLRPPAHVEFGYWLDERKSEP